MKLTQMFYKKIIKNSLKKLKIKKKQRLKSERHNIFTGEINKIA